MRAPKRSEHSVQKVFDNPGGNFKVDGGAAGWADGVLIAQVIDHGQLEEIGSHAMALLEQLEHAAAAHVQQIGEAGAMGRHDVSGAAEQGDLVCQGQAFALHRHEAVGREQLQHRLLIDHLTAGDAAP